MIPLLEKSEIRKQSKPISLKQYHSLIENGLIDENLELLEGVLIEKMPKSPLHRYLVRVLQDFLGKRLPSDFLVFHEEPISIPALESEPEPDLAIIEGKEKDFIKSHPNTARLVMEVAISSLAVDLEKAAIYAKANIPEYLVIDAANKQVIRYYSLLQEAYAGEERISFSQKLTLHTFPDISFCLSDFWPEDKDGQKMDIHDLV